MASNGRFMFVQNLSNGSQQLVLARLLPDTIRQELKWPWDFIRNQSSSGEIVARLSKVPGDKPPGDEVPETFVALLPSPSNQWMAVASVQSGDGFVDINMNILSMTDPNVSSGWFNEHSFHIHRVDASTPSLDKFLAENPEWTDADYSISVDGVESATSPQFNGFAWTASETLIVALGLDVVLGTLEGFGTFLGHDIFDFEVSPTDNPIKILSVNAAKLTVPIAAPLGLTPGNGKVDGEITYNGKLVHFASEGRLKWPKQALFPYRRAAMVAGNP